MEPNPSSLGKNSCLFREKESVTIASKVTMVPVSFELKDTVVRAYRTDPVQVSRTAAVRQLGGGIITANSSAFSINYIVSREVPFTFYSSLVKGSVKFLISMPPRIIDSYLTKKTFGLGGRGYLESNRSLVQLGLLCAHLLLDGSTTQVNALPDWLEFYARTVISVQVPPYGSIARMPNRYGWLRVKQESRRDSYFCSSEPHRNNGVVACGLGVTCPGLAFLWSFSLMKCLFQSILRVEMMPISFKIFSLFQSFLITPHSNFLISLKAFGSFKGSRVSLEVVLVTNIDIHQPPSPTHLKAPLYHLPLNTIHPFHLSLQKLSHILTPLSLSLSLS
ncbi:hypothetical protein VNO77_17021 [Canavalia gladiata]|uniref:Uncharacterized protein n=1 Tax=Canavalia gladiata TaxID=3824 RepID=A0AAN9LIC6_CANGL